MSNKPILCLDFDGVVHSYKSGWKGASIIPDPPVPGAFSFIVLALDHFDVAIFSSRSNQPGGIEAMQNWFIDNGWEGTYLTGPQGLSFPDAKPPAMISIDDRAMTFTGEWPNIQDLIDFRPWHKDE